MSNEARFIDETGLQPEPIRLPPPVLIAKERLDAEIERLASLPAPANGRRRTVIEGPSATVGRGLAPVIQVSLDVLLPGERTVAYRQNSTQVNFVIRGQGVAVVGGKRFKTSLYDVWNTPSMQPYWHRNDGKDIYVRLTYTNAALLEFMNIHFVEEDPSPVEMVKELQRAEEEAKHVNPYGTFPLTEDGAYLMPYEKLIDPPTVESKALHWPWEKVKEHLDKLSALGPNYHGRRLYTLYNPMTGRTNGITPTFFATITVRPPKVVDRPHRHTSSSINYYFHGHGRSTVEGKVYEWKAGDLMLSAPGWAIHNHASYDESVYELTIQDQPMNIAMESLLWQESLKQPLAVLGVEHGFGTNREAS